MMRAVNMAEWDTEKDEIVRGYYDLFKNRAHVFLPIWEHSQHAKYRIESEEPVTPFQL